MTFALLSLLAARSLADGFERPTVPAAALAAEPGATAAWTNPANLAYDPDLTWGAVVQHSVGADTSAAAGAAWRGQFLGLHRRQRSGGPADWSIDLGSSLQLPQRIAVGAMARWRINAARPDYVAWDAGLAWRPLAWLGVAAVTRNIGSPDPTGVEVAQAGAGVALRPFGRTVTVGADWIHAFPGPEPERNEFVGSLRLRPTEGLYVRGYGTSQGRVGGAVEVYFGGQGAGGGASTTISGAQPDIHAWIGNDEPGESLAHARRRVGVIRLDTPPAEAPEQRLLDDDRPAWVQVLEDLEHAGGRRAGEGLAITLDDADLGWARATELRGVIERTRAAGGRVTVILDGSPTNVDYYVAASADHVVMNPASVLTLVGPRLVQTYFKRGLDELGVHAEVLRRSEYKSAGEPWTQDGPSDPARAQLDALLDDASDVLVAAVAARPGWDAERARAAINGGPYTAMEARSQGLVDTLAWSDEIPDVLEAAHGHRVDPVRFDKRPRPHSGWVRPKQIAIIPVLGTIQHGSSGGGLLGGPSAGSRTLVQQLAAARTDDRVAAVVLRVDSPGGSALGSEEIWRAVVQVRAAGKPVVVSMADVAASGGYYVAAPADRIFAHPTTITGSIGVLHTHLSFAPLLERLGVSTLELTRGEHAAVETTLRPWTEAERARMMAILDETYARFKGAVSVGRGLSPDTAEAVARGRVWSGARATGVGLVDAQGGIVEALQAARDLAGISPSAEVDYLWYRERGTLLESLIGEVGVPGVITRALARVPANGITSDEVRAELPGRLEIE